jgi:hypothetical protein
MIDPLDIAAQQGGYAAFLLLGRFLPKLGGAAKRRHFFVWAGDRRPSGGLKRAYEAGVAAASVAISVVMSRCTWAKRGSFSIRASSI